MLWFAGDRGERNCQTGKQVDESFCFNMISTLGEEN